MPASPNSDLPSLLTGKNTIETARIISNALVRRFGEEDGSEVIITHKLIPKGKAPTWASLDRNINLLCKPFYESYEQNEDKIAFIDEIRFILQNLPMRRDYKLPPDKPELSNPRKIAEHFTTCTLCWRSVFKHPHRKTKALCHLHDIPSTHPEYRKRQRLKKHQETIKLSLLKSLPPLFQIRRELTTEKGTELNDYVKSLCLNEDSPLRHLANYLQTLSKNKNIPLIMSKDILDALEYPIYTGKQPKTLKEAFEIHLADQTKHFRLSYLRLLTAEAWLRAETEHSQGGKRR